MRSTKPAGSPARTPGPPPTWVTSAAHSRPVLENGMLVPAPYGEPHARAFGSSTTACGITAIMWTNFHDRPFVPGSRDSCVECSRLVHPPLTASVP